MAFLILKGLLEPFEFPARVFYLVVGLAESGVRNLKSHRVRDPVGVGWRRLRTLLSLCSSVVAFFFFGGPFEKLSIVQELVPVRGGYFSTGGLEVGQIEAEGGVEQGLGGQGRNVCHFAVATSDEGFQRIVIANFSFQLLKYDASFSLRRPPGISET